MLDRPLPDMDSYELAGQLRQETQLGRIVIVVLGGQPGSDQGVADNHGPKPADLDFIKQLLGPRR